MRPFRLSSSPCRRPTLPVFSLPSRRETIAIPVLAMPLRIVEIRFVSLPLLCRTAPVTAIAPQSPAVAQLLKFTPRLAFAFRFPSVLCLRRSSPLQSRKSSRFHRRAVRGDEVLRLAAAVPFLGMLSATYRRIEHPISSLLFRCISQPFPASPSLYHTFPRYSFSPPITSERFVSVPLPCPSE